MDNNIGRITINLKKGDIIKGTKWSEPILIEDIEYYGEDYFCIKGKKLKSNQYVEDILSKNDMENIVIDKLNMDLSANPKEVFLALETKRYRYVSSYDPLLAVNTSIVDPLPHQIEAVYNYVESSKNQIYDSR